MKKIITLLLISVMCLSLVSCGDKDEPDEGQTVNEESKKQDAGEDSVDVEADNTGEPYTVVTDDGQRSVQIRLPEGARVAEYSSEVSPIFERSGEQEGDSIQYVFWLTKDEEAEAVETMKQGVQYLFADYGVEDGSQVLQENSIEADGRQWSYFQYSAEGLEGCRIWTTLQDECIFACTVENIGSDSQPLDIASIANELTGIIVSD